jgi:hypothetical protein
MAKSFSREPNAFMKSRTPNASDDTLKRARENMIDAGLYPSHQPIPTETFSYPDGRKVDVNYDQKEKVWKAVILNPDNSRIVVSRPTRRELMSDLLQAHGQMETEHQTEVAENTEPTFEREGDARIHEWKTRYEHGELFQDLIANLPAYKAERMMRLIWARLVKLGWDQTVFPEQIETCFVASWDSGELDEYFAAVNAKQQKDAEEAAAAAEALKMQANRTLRTEELGPSANIGSIQPTPLSGEEAKQARELFKQDPQALRRLAIPSLDPSRRTR